MSIDLSSQRVAVTGGKGFLGRTLLEKLSGRGCRSPFAPGRDEFDLRTEAGVQGFLDAGRPDILIHLAASVGGIEANRKRPGQYLYDNLMMGAHLIEESRRRDISKFVCIGTVCAYPKFTPVPFKEENLWDGYPEETNAPYGLSKKIHLVQLQAYREQYGMNGIYLLPVNLYGPRDNFDPSSSHVIAALIRKFIEARDAGAPSVNCWGTGAATREFLYVDDCAEAILLATERYEGAAPINLGSGQEISIKDLAERIKALSGFKGELVWDTAKPDGQPRRCLDTSQAEKEFGFVASTKFDEGLARTIAWYEEHRSSRNRRQASDDWSGHAQPAPQ